MKTLRFHVSVAVVAFALAGAGASEAEAQPTQQSPSSSAALDDKARELFRDGVKAAEKSQWAKAHASFLAAWSLKEHYQILGNLGTSEAMLGKWRDAAEHLSRYLREAPKEKVEERKSAEALLAQARTKVGAIAVRVEPVGAEVFVDEVSIGKAPLVNEVFVNPGARVIEARLDGHDVARAKLDAAAGTSREVTLTLVKSASAVGRGATGSGSTASTGSDAGSGAGAAGSAGGSSGARAAVGAQGEYIESGPSKALIGIGIGATVLALGSGIVFAVVSNGHATDAHTLDGKLRQAGGSNPCVNVDLANECEALENSLGTTQTFGNLSVWSFVTGGVVGAGTLIYALATPKPKTANHVQVLPVTSAHGGGLAISGRW